MNFLHNQYRVQTIQTYKITHNNMEISQQVSKQPQIWLSCQQTFPLKYSAKLTKNHSNNWEYIKEIFRSLVNIRCSWMRDILQIDHNTKYQLDDHNDCFRAKVKYDILINGTEEILEFVNQPVKWLKMSREFFIELARHKCISYFNTRISTNFFVYLDECLLELKQMRAEMIKDGVSLYDFVLQDKQYYEMEFNQTMDEELSERYPIYGDVIKSALKNALERKVLLKELLDAQVYTEMKDGRTINLDYDSVHLISRHMSNLDLINILNVF